MSRPVSGQEVLDDALIAIAAAKTIEQLRHPQDKIVMVLDGAGWHASVSLKPPANMRPLPLPPYAPECNPVEYVWDELCESVNGEKWNMPIAIRPARGRLKRRENTPCV